MQRPESAAILEVGRQVASASSNDEADQQIQLQSFVQELMQQQGLSLGRQQWTTTPLTMAHLLLHPRRIEF
jgi:hypothetical protein